MRERSLLFRNANNSLFTAVRHENNVTSEFCFSVNNLKYLCFKRNSRDWSRKLTQRVKANTSKKRKVSLLFDHLEPEELSDHLTYLEFKSFRRISVSKFYLFVCLLFIYLY